MKTIKERAEIYGIESANLLCAGFNDEQRQKQAKAYAKVYELIATRQKAIDIESFKKWAIDNSYIPFDYYNDTKGIEEDRVIPFSDLMDYLKAMEENRV